jgi:hypothetical protein
MPRSEIISTLGVAFSPVDKRGPVEWAEANVDYSRAPSYDCEYKGPYRIDFMPYWREPMETVIDPAVREVIILKGSRVGCSENVLFTLMRWAVALRPQPMLYLNADQQSTEDILDRRVRRGFELSADTARKYRAARVREHETIFADCDVVARWPRSKSAFKSSGYPLIMADEFSTWPDFGWGMLAKRADNYTFAHIYAVSSPDPTSKRGSFDDPIFVEFDSTDQRYWFMPDPTTGKPFKFEMAGLKWDAQAKREDGSWDMRKVEESAHYVTPGGAIIEEARRMATVASGSWVATKEGPPRRRGYHLSAFYSPLENGRFGKIAVEFLTAKHKGPRHVRTFVYEYLAERWADELERVDAGAVEGRCADYGKGRVPSTCEAFNIWVPKEKSVIVTADVQKTYLPAVAREWIEGGDSGLVDWVFAPDFDTLEAFANLHKAQWVGIDCGYAARAMEVFDYAVNYKALPLRGSESLIVPLKRSYVDPYEGRRGQGGTTLETWTFNTDVFKTWLMDMQRGQAPQKWHIYKNPEREYIRQVTSEEKADGAWRIRHGHTQNHLWDCEVMQIVVATAAKLMNLKFWEVDESESRKEPAQ